MAATGDLIEEFKHAKPPEKAVIVLGVVAVGGIGIYLYAKSKNAGAAASTSDPNAAATQQQSGYPTAGGVPVLPQGVGPQYDPNGNLVDFAPTSPTPGPAGPAGPKGPQGPAGSASHPANWFTNILGKVGYNATINPGGFDVNGQRFWIGKGKGANLFYAPIGTQINRGADGRIWIQQPGASKGQLLTGPGMKPSKTVVAKK